MNYSHYQNNAFEWVKNGTGHGQGRALAGSGKTTTQVKATEFAKGSVCTVAFNKRIAVELGRRVPPHVQALTLHSFGFRALGGARLDQWKTSNLLEQRFDMNNSKQKGEYYGMRNQVSKLVSLMKAEGYYTKPTVLDADELADYYSVECGRDRAKILATAIDIFEEGKESFSKSPFIDFDDMIFMPVYLQRPCQTFDWVFVDEYQDMNRVMNDLLKMMIAGKGAVEDPFASLTGPRQAAGGRMFVVGDSHQAIYGFRGACNGIMDDYVKAMSATVLPLNICYRCCPAVIREAQKFVPEIEAAPDAIEGKVDHVSRATFEKDIGSGDFALCRKVAPLVSACLKFIRQGRTAVVLGREIGKQLTDIVDTFGDFGGTLDDQLTSYFNRESERVRNNESKLEALTDRVDTIRVLIEGCIGTPTPAAIKSRIKDLFSDDVMSEAITLCSIHKAKGLEADRVYILPSTPVRCGQEWQAQQERNLQYVAITRARKELYYVS